MTVDEFLAQPLVGRLATNGPTIRPVWFLWEDGAFWWITGAYSKLPGRLAADPEVALVIDSCDLGTGTVLRVLATGRAEVVAMDHARARRKLARYLGGPDVTRWPARFQRVMANPDTRLVRLVPRRAPSLKDQSYEWPTHPGM